MQDALREDVSDHGKSPSPAARQEGQRLCLACGMCCNGDLHKRSLLQAGEVTAARELGLPIVDVDGRPAFQQPCPKHVDDRCTVYHDERKPLVCSSYYCKLLSRYFRGEVEIEECREHVRQARSLIAGLREEIDLDKTAPIWAQLTEWSNDGSPKLNATRMRVGLLMRLLHKVFLPQEIDTGDASSLDNLEARPAVDHRTQPDGSR